MPGASASPLVQNWPELVSSCHSWWEGGMSLLYEDPTGCGFPLEQGGWNPLVTGCRTGQPWGPGLGCTHRAGPRKVPAGALGSAAALGALRQPEKLSVDTASAATLCITGLLPFLSLNARCTLPSSTPLTPRKGQAAGWRGWRERPVSSQCGRSSK